MKTQNLKSLLTLIETCGTIQQLKQVHAKSIILGLAYGQFILTKIIHFFLSTECLNYTSRLFNRTREPEIFIWNAMIKVYSSSLCPTTAILMYNKMRRSESIVTDNYTYPFVFKACGGVFALEKGREVHAVVLRIGFHSAKFLQSSLLNFYTVCDEIENGRRVFDEFEGKDDVFWNVMIMGYARKGFICEAFEMFGGMMRMSGIKPNERTMLGLISACVVSKNLNCGREIHGYVTKELGLNKGVKFGSALIDLYAKCGRLDYARKLFDEMPEKNTVVWNSLICGYSQLGCLKEANDLFQEMFNWNVEPDKFTISALLSACAQKGAFNLGHQIRKFAEKSGIWDVFIGTSLLDMYAKCGFIGMARDLFDQLPEKSVASWNAILSGYASHGLAAPVIELFNEMEYLGAKPDSITFLAILHACAHAGLIEKGKWFFDMMRYYKITPKIEHYGCMVDLLGRGGLLGDARDLIRKMDIEPNVVVWGALLNACSVHGDVEIGEWAAYHIFKLDAMDGGSYVLLANLYAAATKFERVKAVREMMLEKGIYKPPGCSMIEIGNVVHEFIVVDKVHPRSQEIYSVLNDLTAKLKMAGYVPTVALDGES